MDFLNSFIKPTTQPTIQTRRKKTTIEQSLSLELHFLQNDNPLLDQRESIAKEVGINERSIKIWYQNRRAKDKLTRRLSTPFVKRLIPQHAFTVDTIQIGTWQRASIAQDVNCYAQLERNVLHWEFMEQNSTYRIAVKLTSLLKIEFSQSDDKSNGKLLFYTTGKPQFMFKIEGMDEFKHSTDFTADNQATTCLKHALYGPGQLLLRDYTHLVNIANLQQIASIVPWIKDDSHPITPVHYASLGIQTTQSQFTGELPDPFLMSPLVMDTIQKRDSTYVPKRRATIDSELNFPNISLFNSTGPVRNRRLSMAFGLPVTKTSDYFSDMLESPLFNIPVVDTLMTESASIKPSRFHTTTLASEIPDRIDPSAFLQSPLKSPDTFDMQYKFDDLHIEPYSDRVLNEMILQAANHDNTPFLSQGSIDTGYNPITPSSAFVDSTFDKLFSLIPSDEMELLFNTGVDDIMIDTPEMQSDNVIVDNTTDFSTDEAEFFRILMNL